MEVNIDHSKLSNSPYSDSNKETFVFEQSTIDQIKQELLNGTPSLYVISGYRGSGKTSLIKKLESDIKEQISFVFISFAKYDNYSLALRKLIRNLYLRVSTTLAYKNLKKSNDALVNEFDLLYTRTFNDVNINNLYKESSTSSRILNLKINIKKIIYSILFIIATIDFAAVNVDNTDKIILSLTLIFAPIILFLIDSINFNYKRELKKETIDTINRKTLYDDEIAEYYLNEILLKLFKKNIKVIFIFDEFDKIDKFEVVLKIINEFKGIMLTGYVNFIIIAGQKLYYQIKNSYLTDDHVLSNIFGNIFHVSLFNYPTLKNLLYSLIIEESKKQNEEVNLYIDSIILESGRVPRKLLNIVRNNIVWKSNKAYLLINEKKVNSFKFDSNILNVINKIIDNDFTKFSDEDPIKDFFISHLHLWAIRVRNIQQPFYIETILKIDTLDKNVYPEQYISRLHPLCQLFLDRITEDKILLSQKEDANSQTSKTIYEKVDSDEDEMFDIQSIQTIETGQFLNQFIDLEKHVRRIHLDLVKKEKHNLSFTNMITDLTNMNLLPIYWSVNNKILDIVNLRNLLVHGGPSTSNKKKLELLSFNSSRLKSELLENYVFYIIKSVFSPNPLLSINKNRYDFDFIITINNLHLLFDVRNINNISISANEINQHSFKFLNYKSINTSSINHYFIFYFSNNSSVDKDQFYEQLNQVLDLNAMGLKEALHFYYSNDFVNDVSSKSIISFFLDVIKKNNIISNANEGKVQLQNEITQLEKSKKIAEDSENKNLQINLLSRKNDIKPIFTVKSYSSNTEPIRVRLVNINKRAKLLNISYLNINGLNINSTPSKGNYIDTDKSLSIEIPNQIKTKNPNGIFKVIIEFSDIDNNKYHQTLKFKSGKFSINEPIEQIDIG